MTQVASGSSNAVRAYVGGLEGKRKEKYAKDSGLDLDGIAKGNGEITLDQVEKLAKVEEYTPGGFVNAANKLAAKK